MLEIHLNRRGINSIEVPKEAEATPGSDLVLHIVNHGSPTHISISSTNSSPYTDFLHENLYIVGEEEFHISIKDDAYMGAFSLGIISGYGARREEIQIIVREQEIPEPVPIEMPQPVPAHAVSSGWRPFTLPIFLGVVAVVLYGLWVIYQADILNIIAFVTLILGVILAWSRQRS